MSGSSSSRRTPSGQGASSRAAGVVRTQGGTPWAVQLGEWSRQFYLGQRDWLGTDSGFTPQGYVLPCFSEAEVSAARERMRMQRQCGIDVVWLEPDELDDLNPTFAKGKTLGGTYCEQDGYLHPPRNVIAYSVALAKSGVTVAEHTSFTGLGVKRRYRYVGQDQRRRDFGRSCRAYWRPSSSRKWALWRACGFRPAASGIRSR